MESTMYPLNLSEMRKESIPLSATLYRLNKRSTSQHVSMLAFSTCKQVRSLINARDAARDDNNESKVREANPQGTEKSAGWKRGV